MAAMAVLQQVLRGLCGSKTGWCYAVFWKLKRSSRMVLTWEDGYYEHSSNPLQQGHDPIALAVSKMSYHVYSLGEGIIGRVAFSQKHQWVFVGKCPAEKYPAGWTNQFDAGIQTIAIISVPQGVLQLGSVLMIKEDMHLVSHIRATFCSLQSVPGAFLSDYLMGSARPPGPYPCTIGVPIVSGPNFLPSFSRPANPAYSLRQHSVPQQACNLSQNSTRSVKGVLQAEQSRLPQRPIGRISQALSGISGGSSHLGKIELSRFLKQAEANNGVLPPTGAAQVHVETQATSTLFRSSALQTSTASGCFVNPAEVGLLVPSTGGPCGEVGLSGKPLEPQTGSMFCTSNDLQPSSPINATASSTVTHEDSRGWDRVEQDSNNHGFVQNAMTGDDAFPDFLAGEELSNILAKAEPLPNLLPPLVLDSGFELPVGAISQGSEDAELLPVAVISQRNELQNEQQATVLAERPSTSNECPPGPCLENKLRRESTFEEEETEPGRKRAKLMLADRPRPKDRQQLQERVKELREIVPGASKCSIDTLLEKTINHLQFLQNVAHHNEGSKAGSRSSDCPLFVETLSIPGQMLVEMLCRDNGLFLEIAATIRDLGMVIVKGMMETRDDSRVWARFVVESSSQDVLRVDVLRSLTQLLQQ